MPNATAKALEQRLLRAFPPNQPYVPDDWHTAAVPGVVQSFLQHRLLEQLDEIVHAMRQEEMAWVNDNNPKLESARAAFEDALRDNGQIPESDWARLVRQASRIGVSYLVRPVPTATAYLFEGRSTTLSVAYVAYRMQALAPYEYLRRGLDAFVRHRNVQRLDAQTFRETLTKVDRLLTNDYSVDRWLDTLTPLFDAAEAAYGDPGCPVRVLHPFFAHKEQSAYAERLRALGDDRTLTQDELRAVLSNAQSVSGEARASAPRTTSEASSTASARQQRVSSEPEPMHKSPEPEPEPPVSEPPESEPSAPSLEDDGHPWGDRASRMAEDNDEDAPTENEPASAQNKAPASPSATASGNRTNLWGNTTPDSAGEASSDKADKADTPSPSTWDVPSGPRPVSSDVSENDASTNDGPVPLWKQFRASKGSGNAENASSESSAGGTARWQQFGSSNASTSRASAAQNADATSETPSNNTSGDRSSAPSTGRVDALENEVLGDIAADRRRMFVQQLFKGSTDHYAEVLSTLRNATSWNEASQVIAQDVFRRNKINIYSDAAVSFTNAVERRYR